MQTQHQHYQKHSAACLDHEDGPAPGVGVGRDFRQQRAPPAGHVGQEIGVLAPELHIPSPAHLSQVLSSKMFLY